MSKSFARMSLVALTAALAACGNEPTTVPAGAAGDAAVPLVPPPLTAARASGGGTVERPWSGRCEFSAERLSPTLIRITGVCNLAHLGRTTYVNLQTLVPGPVTQFTNATTYTAANGDLLHTTAAGTVTPTDGGTRLSAVASETVVGGTGRFAGASGQAAFAGTVFLTGPAAGTGFYELAGTLGYAASDRSR